MVPTIRSRLKLLSMVTTKFLVVTLCLPFIVLGFIGILVKDALITGKDLVETLYKWMGL